MVVLLPLALAGCASAAGTGSVPTTSSRPSVSALPERTQRPITTHEARTIIANQSIVDRAADDIEALPEARRSIGGLKVDVLDLGVTVWWVGEEPPALRRMVTEQPYGVRIVVHAARHPRADLDRLAGEIAQDGIDGRGPAVTMAGALVDGSGIRVGLAPDPARSDQEVVAAAVSRISARYRDAIAVRGVIRVPVAQTGSAPG